VSLPNLPDVPRDRRGTATAVAIGAFAVLCLLALVLGLKGLFASPDGEPASGGGPAQGPRSAGASTPAEPQTTSGGTGATTTSSTPPAADLAAFESPSGNIRCSISSQGARCDISHRDWTAPPRPASCILDWGQGLAVDADGASVVCAGDTVERGSALAYGTSIDRGEFRCESEQAGVQCTHRPSGHGFSIARSAYRLS
jgi:hypothetical protein